MKIFAADIGREIREVKMELLPRPKREERTTPPERRERQVHQRRRKREKVPT